MSERQDYIQVLENRVRELDLELRALRLCLDLLRSEAPDIAAEQPQKRATQRTLDGRTVEPSTPRKPRIRAHDPLTPGQPTGERGPYKRNIQPEEFDKEICLKIQTALIDELSKDRDKGVPILYVTEQLGANRNNGYYTAKKLAMKNHDLAYVRWNGWEQRSGFLVGLMSRARARELELTTEPESSTTDSKEETEHGDK